jgi:putative endonuclease
MINKRWFVYILECEDKSLYTGHSFNVAERFAAHCTGKGAKYTKSHRPLKILYTEEYGTKIEAIKRERQIKGWSRKKKLEFIKKMEKKILRKFAAG